MRKGVMFLGDPEDVRLKILEVIKGIKGRILALYESMELTEHVDKVPIMAEMERVSALLSF